ncbi:hypothetical protein A2851_04275 [Candidatus Kaiserbacteria bacterium RIFCSPHIGHO2_01_FULL_53_29]|uniref:Uncharacterized protein n=1 Tax=Candidatus Kaiserbacteria bacterium RIFCSPHIGHO2_01_FULL_53_29 TaxID=1798480 RepID=A0A1F6CUQ9_9BACT|nr:MAG: hypothetical protein A2851_04275 [Candidatus Kaiserbacteria bacterium RIFCSPHIGHO2_01_FULL_53_29]
MRKITISVATLLILGSLLAYGGIRAFAASSLFGDAETVGGGNPGTAVQIRSDDSPGWGGIFFDDMNGEPFSSLGELSTDFNVTDDNCGASSPRFTITVTDGVITKNIFVNLGDHPDYNTCPPNTWVSSGNLLDGAANHTLDTSRLPGGTFYDTYAHALAEYGAYTIQGISVETDAGADPGASVGGDGEQTVLIDNVRIIKNANFFYDFEPPPPATLVVDDDHAQCPAAAFTTIQSAVNAAGPGDTVQVCAGTYDEQVVIASKNLTVQGAGGSTIVRPSSAATLTSTYTYPAGNFFAGTVMSSIILVTDTDAATIKDLKVDGANVTTVPTGASRVAGILYGETGGTIDNVSVTDMVVAGYVTRTYGIDLTAVGTARSVEVKDSDITDWSRNGIQVQGASLTADIHDNTLVGPGDVLVGAAVPNGILFIGGAGGSVTDNTINAMHHSLSGSRSAGILFFDPVAPGIVVEGNNISDTDDGVLVGHNANDVIILDNNLHDNLEVGIHLEDGATNTTITGNTITGNPMGGIRFAGAADPGTPDTPPGGGNVANRNNITGNAVGVAGYDAQVFDAECNWWGDASGPSGAGPGTGDSTVGNVDFEPWLTTSDLVGDPCDGPLTGATLTLLKTVDNTGGGAALDTDWTLTASSTSDATVISGAEGDASVTNAGVAPGSYDLTESGPSGYTASDWVCTVDGPVVNFVQDDGNTVTIADGENVTCVITNTFVAPTPPPPEDACDTPLVEPSGYNLVNGSTANDNVTIAPFTMWVGKGGNDVVKGPADGNYIVCTGTGNDIITLGNGDFTIAAGTGSNSITAGNGDGYISSGTAGDKITTGDGVQTIDADGGNNIISTGNGDKTVTTGTGNDNVQTGSGADVIDAGGGTNNVKSGAGDDNVTTGTGNDTIDGGANFDVCNAGGGVNSLSNCEA